MITLAELLQVISPTAMRNTLVAALVALGIPADKWRARGGYSSILTVLATQLSAFTQIILTPVVGSFFLLTASGQWLTLVAWYVYGVLRPPATFASGPLVLTNGGGGVFNYPAQAQTFTDSSTGATYTNSDAIALGVGGTQTITIQASVAGSSGSANPGDIDTTAMPGVTVTNPYALQGLDALDDPSLVTLCLNKLGAMSVRGVRSAYAYAVQTATNPTTGAPVNVNRWQVSPFSRTGVVNVWVASPSGAATAGDVQGCANNIEQVARPNCVTVNTMSAAVVPYAATITVYARSVPGLNVTQLQANIATAIAAFFSGSQNNPIGGLAKTVAWQFGQIIVFTGVYAAALDAAILAVDPSLYDVDGTFDMALVAGQVAGDATSVVLRVVAGQA